MYCTFIRSQDWHNKNWNSLQYWFCKNKYTKPEAKWFFCLQLRCFFFPNHLLIHKVQSIWKRFSRYLLRTTVEKECMWRIYIFSVYELSKNVWEHYWLTCSFTQFVVVYSALKGTQAWDIFEFFFDLNQILICPS